MFRGMLLLLVMLMGNRSKGQQLSSRNGGLSCSDIFGDIFGETEPSGSSDCQFPFIYMDVRYSDCTRKDDPQGKLWCSTKTDSQNNHLKGNFKLCEAGTFDPRSPSAKSTCKFPFIYKNVRYSQCTTIDASDGKPWCSTKTDSQSNHMKGNFKHCKNSRTSSGASACIFPFVYKDVQYSQCTRKDDPAGKLWCSTGTDSQNNHQKGSFRHCTGSRRKRSSPVSPFCKFPFIYKNIKYSNCTTVGDPEGLPWCSTRTDSQSKHIKGNFKHCIGPQRTRIYPGTSKCTFPFIYKDQIYFDCTTKDDPERKPWCSTRTDSQKKHQKGNFQHCSLGYDASRTGSSSTPIFGCNAKIPAQEPVDQQIVYLEEEGNPSYWYYVTYNSYASTYEHPKPEIVETEDNWAGWIWHECGGPDIVCLESQEFQHWYFLFEHYKYPEAAYTVDPHREDWTKLKIIRRDKTDRGVRMELVRLTFNERIYAGSERLTLIVYVPPYCAGFQKIRTYLNDPTKKNPVNVKYKLKFGVTKTSTTTHVVNIGVKGTISKTLGAVASSGGAGASGAGVTVGGEASFGYTFTQVEATTEVKEEETNLDVDVDPGETLDIWQKVLKYGNYEKYSVTTLFCPTNGQI